MSGRSTGSTQAPPLFLDQTEAQTDEKEFFGDRPLFSKVLRVWTAPPPLPISSSGSGTAYDLTVVKENDGVNESTMGVLE